MGKAKRKPKPSMPHWYWLGQDGCWFCPRKKYRKACGGCSVIKHDAKNFYKLASHKDKQNKEREKWERET